MPNISTSQFIDARPDRVWRVLSDLDSYREWNPFIVEASGDVTEGARLKLKMRPPGGREMGFSPKVLRADPGRELRWKGRLLVPGLFDGEHYFKLEPEGEGTRVTQGEDFTGLLPRLMGKMLGQTELGFKELNSALKQRVEEQ